MAEVIDLATFQFDTAKLEQSLSTLQSRMFELKKESEGYSNQNKAVQKSIDEVTKAQLKLAASGKETSDEYKENEKLLKDLSASQEQLYKNIQNTTGSMSRVRVEISATNKQLQAYMDSEARQNTLIDAGNVALGKQITNINQARASNTELLRVRNQLNPAIAEEAKMIVQLNQQLDKNNAFIKENASQYEKQKINIGNYTQSIKDALAETTIFGVSIGGLKNQLEPFINILSGIKDEIKGYASQITNASAGTEQMSLAQKAYAVATNIATGATKIFALALAATGIGLIISAVVLLIGYFKTFDPVVDAVEQAFSGLGAAVRTVQTFLKELFSSFSNFTNFLKNPIKALGELSGKMAEAASAAADLKAAQQDLEDSQRAQSVLNKKQEGEINRLMLQAKDRSKTEAERIALLDKAEKVNQANFKANTALAEKQTAQAIESARISGELSAKELANLQKYGTAYAIQLMNRGKITEEEVALIEAAENSKIEIYNRSTQEQEKIINRRNLNIEKQEAEAKKAAEDAKKRNDEAIEASKKRAEESIKAMQTELDYYIASQGDRKKDMADQLAIDREVQKQSLEIAKAEYDAKKLTKREYELAVLEINQEFASKQAEATIANAEIEFELFKLNNQRKLDENKFFSEQLYNQELERINRVAEAEAAQRTLDYTNGVISAEEYVLAIAQIDENQRVANEAAAVERKAAQKEKEAADLAIQDELNAERFEYDLALQLERFDRKYAAEKEAAVKAGADMVAFEKAQAERRKEIEAIVQNNKVELASNTLGNLATIAGKESALGKAFSIMQTTIDTYQAATAAYKAMAGIPVVGPALGIAAAGAAVVAGIANVKKIASVKSPSSGGSDRPRPSYATGIVGVGTGTSDSITANLSNGESVLTARATQMFAPQIAAMNQAGGGVGLNGMLQGSSSAMVQDSIRSAADSSMNVEAIAEAVMVGARLGSAEGSQRGIVGLSDNRQIMESGKF